jgi:hypothetical protein
MAVAFPAAAAATEQMIQRQRMAVADKARRAQQQVDEWLTQFDGDDDALPDETQTSRSIKLKHRWVVHIEYLDMADDDDEEYYHYFDRFKGGVKWREVS